ncbi:MAG: ATP-binding cassette domain-containing protein [Dehalococcoidia bacterium]|uniref:ATP-binding cassette domain-containing protein n=1 Tax=Candidatus Amarobacter glycogenicus TaxID=3140699 RepID=UPI002A129D8C|nr:ATP-binding cassette domain-containing protein [Dehalococcoidia bacterium]MBK7126692.1 ATP-binding cassette domain-containing protein [Dehalococcoidia bacterium]MBK7329623.1 ATP-binding cassette domain-containing protein [Dehalococcoidia bacterium]MBK8561609.1 ATP-binding cassette domain-containing protein [Dehalococcoidia bacterium]MBK9342824.1 ATP-binding cassette domain-containing protein [Dehalococcoidia bacterium]
MSAVAANGLVKHFSPDIRAVDGIDLDIPEGQVFGFLGQNGSGKTTTVRMLTTLLRPTAGTARVGGIDVLADPDRVRKLVGVALQEVGLDDLQTGREQLSLQSRLFGISSGETRRRVDHLLEIVSLTDAADRPVKGYSGGMKRRLDLACALVHEPRIIFLDEPTTGLDPVTRDQVWRYVEELNRDGVTFFLTTQYLEEADRLCHDIAIMDRGKIVAKGSPAELKSSIGTDAITVLFASDDDAQRADSRIRQLPGIDSTALAGREVVAYLRNGASAVAGIVLALNDAGLTVSELRLAQATLDDVFLRATGHHLEVDKRVEVAAVAGGAA